eukprot:881964-Prymnesium_polylepis.1
MCAKCAARCVQRDDCGGLGHVGVYASALVDRVSTDGGVSLLFVRSCGEGPSRALTFVDDPPAAVTAREAVAGVGRKKRETRRPHEAMTRITVSRWMHDIQSTRVHFALWS